MQLRHFALFSALLALTATALACDAAELEATPEPTPELMIGRQLIIPVANESALPALLIVAEDTSPVGRVVGIAEPHVVPPNSRMVVVFTVPDTQSWAIFVNPGQEPGVGPLLTAHDVRLCVGRVPIEIGVGRTGDVYWSMSGERSCVNP
jgi:hypothetical protein